MTLWPPRLCADRGEAHIECTECDPGDLLVARVRGMESTVADLTARLEARQRDPTRRW